MITPIQFLEKAYPNRKISKMGSTTQGILYENLVFKSDLEKINILGFDIVCIQASKDSVLVTVRERLIKTEAEN